MRRGEDSNTGNNILLRQSILQSIAYLQSKVYLQEKEVYELIRAFFKEYLGLDYEFTHEELLIELQNVFYDKKLEDQVLAFLRDVSKIEYSDEEYKPEDLKNFLDEFSKIIDLLIKSKHRSTNFLKKLIFWKEHKDEEIPVETKENEEIVEVIEDMEKGISVDMKKGLFGKDKKIPERRIQEDDKKISKVDKVTAQTETVKEPTDNKASLSLVTLTDELNNHIDENREYPKRRNDVGKDFVDNKSVNKKSSSKKNISAKEHKDEEVPVELEVPTPDDTFTPVEDNLVEHKDEEVPVDASADIPAEETDVVNEAIISKNTKQEKPNNIKTSLKQMRKNPSIETYQEIQILYALLSEADKKKYYKKVLNAYAKVNNK